MSHRIKKSAVKWAWSELRRLEFDPAAKDADSLVTAAALSALREREDRVRERLALPPATGLEFEGERVLLSFQPEAAHAIRFPVPEAAGRDASGRFGQGREPLRTPLQVLALKALEPNFEWLSEPEFEGAPSGAGGKGP